MGFLSNSLWDQISPLWVKSAVGMHLIIGLLACVIYILIAARRRPRGHPTCCGCGYNLTELASDACPECGDDLLANGVYPPGKPDRRHWWIQVVVATLFLTWPTAWLVHRFIETTGTVLGKMYVALDYHLPIERLVSMKSTLRGLSYPWNTTPTLERLETEIVFFSFQTSRVLELKGDRLEPTATSLAALPAEDRARFAGPMTESMFEEYVIRFAVHDAAARFAVPDISSKHIQTIMTCFREFRDFPQQAVVSEGKVFPVRTELSDLPSRLPDGRLMIDQSIPVLWLEEAWWAPYPPLGFMGGVWGLVVVAITRRWRRRSRVAWLNSRSSAAPA